MSQHRIIRYALSSQTKILIDDYQISSPMEILFEDQVTISDGSAKPYLILLQLTSKSLIIRPINTTKISLPRNVLIERDPITHSFGFSIKGGEDTGFPVLISRVLDMNAHLLHIGDAILAINNEDISNFTHDQVITKLRDISSDQVNLKIQYMDNMATYLHLTSPKPSAAPKSMILPRKSYPNRWSADYSAKTRSSVRQRKHLSLVMTDDRQIDDSYIQQYSLIYAYVSQYLNGTDKLRLNSFQVHTFDGSRTGIIIVNTPIQRDMWISRINMVIRHLTTRTLGELNQTFLSNEQVFYANWVHERIVNVNKNHLPEWKAIFLVFKGHDIYLFDENRTPPLCAYDFIRCQRVYSIIEIFIEIVSLKSCLDDRKYCFTLTLPNDSIDQCRYLNFERKNEYEDFISNYQRSLYISVYSIQNRSFGCVYQGQICRLVIDINKGFEMYNNETNVILWAFTFEQLLSSSDNGRDTIYFQFKNFTNETIIHMEIQCQHLRILIHVINAFLTVKFISQR